MLNFTRVQVQGLTSKRWTTEEARKEQAALMSELWASEDFRRARNDARWKGTRRNEHITRMQERHTDPTFTTNLRAGYDAFWANPENRKIHSEQLRARHQRNRERKPVLADGVLYKTVRECAAHYGRSIKWVRAQVKRGIFHITPTESDQ